jgi:metallo-beta-lactamase family protein
VPGKNEGNDMKVTVYGAGGGEVTGSAYLLQTREANVLVDFGLFQGARKVENYNRIPKQGAFEQLNAVVLTHAHLDHTGRLPLLTRAGYRGPIYATPATIDFADLIMSDSARLQRSDVERQNRRRARMGQPLLDPLYEQRDVEGLRPPSTRNSATTNRHRWRPGSRPALSRRGTCSARPASN